MSKSSKKDEVTNQSTEKKETPKPKYSKDNPYLSCRLDTSKKENEHS